MATPILPDGREDSPVCMMPQVKHSGPVPGTGSTRDSDAAEAALSGREPQEGRMGSNSYLGPGAGRVEAVVQPCYSSSVTLGVPFVCLCLGCRLCINWDKKVQCDD